MNQDQIGRKLMEISISQATTNAQLGAIKELLTKHIDNDETTFRDHEKRIRDNERGRWFHTGAAAFLGSVATAALTYIKFGGN